MDQLYQNTLLDKINMLQGLTNAKETILQYARYIKLVKQDKIKNIGNSNIIINCPYDYSDRKSLINLLLEILDCKDAHLLTKRDLINDTYFNKIDADVVILDLIELQSTFRFNIADLKHRATNCNGKIFIVITCDLDKNNLAYVADEFSWWLDVETSSIADKEKYILNKLRDNDIKVASSCKKYISDLADDDLVVIGSNLLDLIIDCKSNGITTIDNAFLDKHIKSVDAVKQDADVKSSSKSALSQLDSLIGLDNVKNQIHQIVNYVKITKSRGKLPMLHMMFEGPSGSGKNEIARLVGQIFKEENILSGGQFIEVSRADLVAGYVGQTALKTQDVIGRAKGGVLFIDEAYSLDSRDSGKDYGSECISTLIKAMEDYRDNLCVILAGYTQDMEQLLKSNRGFSSRIQFRLKFNDYTADELYKIFKKMLQDDGYKLSSNVESVLVEHFNKIRLNENFGNGRYARSLFEKVKFEQADRLSTDATADINDITEQDVVNVIHRLEINLPKSKKIGFAV